MELTSQEQALMADIPADALVETWDSLQTKSLELSRLVSDHCATTGEGFDRLVVVPRGGYYPANILSRELGFSSVDILHACLRSYHQEKAEQGSELEVGQMPNAAEVNGQRLLIVEEVCDSGQTLQYLYDDLVAKGAAMIRSAVLHYKPAKNKTGFKPDWWITETDKWIVYPYEISERRGKHSIVRQRQTAANI